MFDSFDLSKQQISGCFTTVSTHVLDTDMENLPSHAEVFAAVPRPYKEKRPKAAWRAEREQLWKALAKDFKSSTEFRGGCAATRLIRISNRFANTRRIFGSARDISVPSAAITQPCAALWRHLEDFMLKADEHLSAVVVDAGVAVVAAGLVTFIVRSIFE